VTAVTTVTDVIQIALEKFGLEGSNPDYYSLTEVHLNQGGKTLLLTIDW